MDEKTTIEELKKVGAVGQVVAGGINRYINRYVVVEETAEGVNVTCLYSTVIGNPDKVFEVPDDTEIYVEDKAHWKERFLKRWEEIAQSYPAIG